MLVGLAAFYRGLAIGAMGIVAPISAAGPIVQKEHSGWDTTCAVAKIIWPDLSNADGPPPVLQRNVDAGRIGMKTGHGFFPWDADSMAQERARYERALRKCLEIFKEEGII